MGPLGGTIRRFRDSASIMPDYFQGVFGGQSGIRGIELVSPRVEKSVGLLFMQRSPAPPLVEAPRAACRDADLTAVVNIRLYNALRGGFITLLGSFRHALLSQVSDSFLKVAIGCLQCLSAVQHAGTGCIP